MKFAISVITPEVQGEAPLALLEGTFEERLAKAAAFGYQGIELLSCNPACLDPERILRLLEKYNLKAAAIATGFIAGSRGLTIVHGDPQIRQQARELLKDLIRFAAAVGAPLVTIGGFRGKAAFVGSLEEAKGYLHEALAAADPLARELNVTIALEPIRAGESDLLNTAEEVCDLIHAGSYTSVGLLLDIFHMRLSEPDPVETFRIYRDRLVHVHLADTDRMGLGQGTYDFGPMETALREIGYTGWQSVELPRGDDPDGNGRLPEYFLSL